MKSMDNKRRSERHEVNHPLMVYDQSSGSVLGTLVNLSVDGLMLLGDFSVQDGSVYQVRVPISPDDGVELRMGIECLWMSEADSGSKQWSGFRIIDISEVDKVLLDTTIDHLGASE